ncbi:MAG: ABC transporter permease [Kiritimatiellae bacterium]|nr:ABC transporter permease [Kiritimatiellia bacterium]
MSILTDIFAHRELLGNLIVRNLKSRYKDSVLGFLWSVLTPLFMAGIYMVFLRILARGIPMTEILIGVFAWQFTVQCIFNGLTCITENGNLIKKVYFPRVILPLATAVSNLVNFLLTLVVQFVLLAVLLGRHGQHISLASAAVPAVIIVHFFFCFGIILFLSSSNVYFRDLEHLVNVLVMAFFFITPVMYPYGMVEQIAAACGLPFLADLYMANPMAVIISAYRALILPGAAFPLGAGSSVGAALALVFVFPAYYLFKKLQRNFSDMF